ncbi:hypothetical protein APHMUC_0425 [Anaplasma phagocytophilum str. ApMUC09]|uniref:Uncharacterized protein n=1 Tax=Anaplasma phagocytophilum str. ApMUC09 TaxID=1359152 RepID=A0A0F3NAF5_ANAPH|nr:hypothetical protein APHMUC_0425 [Anaplasma phagocytophilum str. ApMUC09]
MIASHAKTCLGNSVIITYAADYADAKKRNIQSAESTQECIPPQSKFFLYQAHSIPKKH